MKPEDLIERYNSLTSARSTWEAHWQEIVDYLLPFRQSIYIPGTPGEKRLGKIYDSAPTHALLILSSGLNTLLTNPAVPWFNLRMRQDWLNEMDEVKIWLDHAEQVIYGVLANSNFYTEIHECYVDLAGFGTAALYVGEDDQTTVSFAALDVGEVFLAEDARKRVDTVIRKFSLSARQIMQEFGQGSEEVQKAAREEKDKDKMFEVLHCTHPRSDARPDKRNSRSLPYASIYIERQSRYKLRESGYHELPYMCPRWFKMGGEVYGRSQGMIALPDAKMLYEMKKLNWRAAVKKIDPPIFAKDEAIIGPVRNSPLGITIVRGDSPGNTIFPLPTPQDVGLGLEMQEQVKLQIREVFFNNLLQLLTTERMTATEVMQRYEENMRILGPAAARLQNELLTPLIDRVFGLLSRQGYFPLPPEVMQGSEYEVEYVSPLARAQKMSEVQSVYRVAEFMGPLAQMDPTVIDNLNLDAVARHVCEVQGLPQKLLRGQREIAALRQGRAQQAAQQMQAQQAAQLGGLVPEGLAKLGKAPEPGSPSEMMLTSLGLRSPGMEAETTGEEAE